jgi:hypothetical protein
MVFVVIIFVRLVSSPYDLRARAHQQTAAATAAYRCTSEGDQVAAHRHVFVRPRCRCRRSQPLRVSAARPISDGVDGGAELPGELSSPFLPDRQCPRRVLGYPSLFGWDVERMANLSRHPTDCPALHRVFPTGLY